MVIIPKYFNVVKQNNPNLEKNINSLISILNTNDSDMINNCFEKLSEKNLYEARIDFNKRLLVSKNNENYTIINIVDYDDLDKVVSSFRGLR